MKKKMALFFCLAVSIFFVTYSFSFANYFNGGQIYVNNNGAEALIPCQDVYVDPITGASSSAWAMTNDRTNIYNYAQVGWSKAYGEGQPYLFWEWGNGNQYDQRDFALATIGKYYDCKVGCDSTTMYFIIDNVTYNKVSLTAIPWPRNTVRYCGEIYNQRCQCPGTVRNKLLFSNLKYKNTSNIWTDAPYSPYVSGTAMGNTFYSDCFYIWDTRWN